MTTPIDNGFARVNKESIIREYTNPAALTGQDIAYDGTSTINEKIDGKAETSTIQETIEDTIGTKVVGSGVVNVNYNDGTGETTISAVGLGTGDMQGANNLSELTDESIARSNLGLGTLATQSGTFSGTSSGTNSGDETATRIGALIGGAGDATPNDTDFIATSLTAGGILKKITWTNTKAFLKTYFDTLYAKYLGDADFYKYSIVTSVASGNLTVALKNYEGNDPTASKPVKIQIGGVIRTITSVLSFTSTGGGGNYCNAGSAELATKEIDWFLIAVYDSVAGAVKLIGRRIGDAITLGNVVYSFTDERGFIGNVSGIINNTPADPVVNICRFNATLSAGLAWSIPATSVIINSPCYETRWLDYSPSMTWIGTSAPSGTVTNVFLKYKISGNICFVKVYILYSVGGVGITRGQATVPFLPIYDSQIQASLGFAANNYIQQSFATNSSASLDVFITTFSTPDRFIISGDYII